MKYTYPHTINNGHGEEITFLSFTEDGAGGILEVVNHVQPGAGPPMHLHHLQDESLTVVQGKIAGQVFGKSPTFHGPGETVTFKKGVAHRFWNAGEGVLICTGSIRPAYNFEYFLTEIFHSTSLNASPRPGLFAGAYLQTRYKSEFDMVEIPGFVKKVIFPLIISMGQLNGAHRRFLGAPPPVTVYP